ncbi:hypothetical protein [Pseudoalteromonas sp.]|uniref:hypothetical protein n=1 Tax=Pseudoalteromonas sp. TaxID=53249 RepID=UPI003562941F
MTIERAYVKSGRNTIIHKEKKYDLIIINGDAHPKIRVTADGLQPYKESVPRNRREAKERYVEVVQIGSPDVFGEEKQLLFIQALDNREYKIDYSKVGTKMFVRVHQESYL